MIALELTNIKDFMNKLLKTETFDHFLLQEAVLSSAAIYRDQSCSLFLAMFKKCKICIYKLFNILPAKPDILRL